jgi:hypothetical protein
MSQLDRTPRKCLKHWTLGQRLAFYSAAPDSRGCILFTGSIRDCGHGQIGWQGKMLKAHRAAWIVKNGPIPSGLCVCHRCDVPACINPDHLFLGTQVDNIDDMHTKGRGAAFKRRLTDEQIAHIRAARGRQIEIASRFGVSRAYVSMLRSGAKRSAGTANALG